MVEQKPKTKVIVIGGAVMDLVFPIREFPIWTQAVQAQSFRMFPGGKGLNQAVAASKLGADVKLISAIGDDDFGERILSYLELHRIPQTFIRVVESGFTDVTGVFVNEEGNVAFIGWKGISSTEIDKKLIIEAETQIKEADVIMMTFEVSLEVIEEAIKIAKSNDTMVVLNPAPPLEPLEPPPYYLLESVDVIVPNKWEASQFLRKDADPKELANSLCEMGAGIACVTNAEYNCAVATKGKVSEHPSFLIGKPVDTTGGSDAFCAALAISLAMKKLELDDAITVANAAAALAVIKRGGSPSMPTAEELNRFLRQRGATVKFDSG